MKGKNRRTQKQRETDPILEGLSPLPHHGDQGPEGTLLPSREEVKEEEEEGGLSPPLFQWRRNAVGAIIITAIYTNNFTAVITNSSPLYAAV